MTPEIRGACYDAIRQCMKDGVARYYRTHPELMGDKRSDEAIRWSLEGLACIFRVLDQYDLVPHVEKKAGG
jgi:hypothetical protein